MTWDKDFYGVFFSTHEATRNITIPDAQTVCSSTSHVIMSVSNLAMSASSSRYTVTLRGLGVAADTFIRLLEQLELFQAVWRLQAGLSVAIFDHTTQQLTLYRDPVGRYPLYWVLSEGQLVWSTSILDLLPARLRLNPAYFYRYLVGGGFTDLWPETPFLGIDRVPRGCALTFKSPSLPPHRHIDRLRPNPEVVNLSRDNAHKAFTRLLAGITRQYGGDSALFECSGGLDSTSLLIAHSLEGTTKSAAATYVFDRFAYCDERENARSVAEKVGIRWYSINAEDSLPFDLSAIQKQHLADEPPDDLTLFCWRLPMMQLAYELGYKIVISGHGGNHLLDGNYCFIADLLKRGKVAAAWHQAHFLAHKAAHEGRTALSTLVSYGIHPLVGLIQPTPAIPSQWDPAIHDRFPMPSYLSNLNTARAIHKEMTNSFAAIQLKTEFATQLARTASSLTSLQTMDAIGRHLGIEAAYPYFDRKLIEFVLGLPRHYLIDNAQGKLLTRQAFAELLPKGFVRTQGNYYRLMFEGLNRNWSHVNASVRDSALCRAGIISQDRALGFLAKWRYGKEQDTTAALHALVSACFWLTLGGWEF